MGRINRLGTVHRNARFIQNEKGEFLHFIVIDKKVTFKFMTDHVGASIFLNEKNCRKFIVKHSFKNCKPIKAKPIINKAEEDGE